MKALSLWQPWATLVILGLKRFETRSWHTNYRGPLMIHAAKHYEPGMDFDDVQILLDHDGPGSGLQLPAWPHGYPFGVLLGTVRMTGCYRTAEVAAGLSPLEREVGDFSPGRYAWAFEHPQPLPAPIKWRGAQRLFEVNAPVPDGPPAQGRLEV